VFNNVFLLDLARFASFSLFPGFYEASLFKTLNPKSKFLIGRASKIPRNPVQKTFPFSKIIRGVHNQRLNNIF